MGIGWAGLGGQEDGCVKSGEHAGMRGPGQPWLELTKHSEAAGSV